MQNRIVEWNPSIDSNQFAVGNGSKLELLEINEKSSLIKKYKDIYTHPHAIQSVVCTSLNWHPDQSSNQSIIAYGTSIGQVNALSWASGLELLIHNSVAASRRVCTGMSWNKQYQRYLAAGFEKSRSANEFCAIVWDVERSENILDPSTNEMISSTAVVFKPISDEPISSITWLNDPHLLAVGTSLSFVRLYDIRMKANYNSSNNNTSNAGSAMNIPIDSNSSSSSSSSSGGGGLSNSMHSSSIITDLRGSNLNIIANSINSSSQLQSEVYLTISAHVATRPRKVKGIRQDPFNDSILATFSDAALESVKIWDLRKGSNNNFKPIWIINPYEAISSDSSGSSSGSGSGINANRDEVSSSVSASNTASIPTSVGRGGGRVITNNNTTSSYVGRDRAHAITASNISTNNYNSSNNPLSPTTNTNSTASNTNSTTLQSSSSLSSSSVVSATASVVDIAWSTSRTNTLAVATTHQKHIAFYSTAKVPTELYTKIPLYTIPVKDTVKCLAWQVSASYTGHKRRFDSANNISTVTVTNTTNANIPKPPLLSNQIDNSTTSTSGAAAVTAANIIVNPQISIFVYNKGKEDNNSSSNHHHELLIATAQGMYYDLCVTDSVGLSVSPCDDKIVTVQRTTISFLTNSNNKKNKSASTLDSKYTIKDSPRNYSNTSNSSASASTLLDIDSVMKARCHAGYSIDTGRNLQILSDELDLCYSSSSGGSRRGDDKNTPSLTSTLFGTVGAVDNKQQQQLWQMKVKVEELYKTSISNLISVWSWLHRVETLKNNNSSDLLSSSSSPLSAFTLTLRSCGILQLMSLPQTPPPPITTINTAGNISNTISSSTGSSICYHNSIGTNCYQSVCRRIARLICGWTADVCHHNSNKRSTKANRNNTNSNTTASKRMTANNNNNVNSSRKVGFLNSNNKMNNNNNSMSKLSINSQATVQSSVKSLTSRDKNSNGGNSAEEEDDDEEDEEGSNNSNDESNYSHDSNAANDDDDVISTNNINNSNGDDDNDSDNDDDIEDEESLQNLHNIITDCTNLGYFERAAALSLFNGHIELTVNILQSSYNTISAFKLTQFQQTTSQQNNNKKMIANNSNNNDDEEEDDDEDDTRLNFQYEQMSAEYLHGVSLVAMCVAGYSNSNSNSPFNATAATVTVTDSHPTSNSNNSHTAMWISMCQLVLTHLNTLSLTERQQSCCYLIAICQFLLENMNKSNIQQQQHNDAVKTTTKQLQMKRVNTRNNTTATTATTTTANIRFTHHAIVTDERLSLEDRIGFACTYLNDVSVLEFLRTLLHTLYDQGSLSGLIITGLGENGLEILQRYIDVTSDIQTAALIIGRVVDVDYKDDFISVNMKIIASASSSQINLNNSVTSTTPVMTNSTSLTTTNSSSSSLTAPPLWRKEVVWLNEYRSLLNRWKYYFARALLDVELGKLFRHQKSLLSSASATSSSSANSTSTNNMMGVGGSSGQMNRKMIAGGASGSSNIRGGGSSGSMSGSASSSAGPASSRILYTLPPHRNLESPHIFLRCHYCSTSLPVDPMQQNQTTLSYLRKQKPVINCCPHCKKQLPRCYVCLLYMGVINPNAEFNRMMTIRRLTSENALLLSKSNNNNQSSTTITTTIGDNNATTSNIATTALLSQELKVLEHNTLEYGRWFFFCQRCRHGGHASCIEAWFNNSGSNSSSIGDNTSGGDNSNHNSFGNFGNNNNNNNSEYCVEVRQSSSSQSYSQQQQQGGVMTRDVCGVSGCSCHCQAWR